MAWQTQMQQAYGTGGATSRPTIAQGLTGGAFGQALRPMSSSAPGQSLISQALASGAPQSSAVPQAQSPFGQVEANTRTPWSMQSPQASAAQAQSGWNAMYGPMPTSRVKDMRDAGTPSGSKRSASGGGLTATPDQAGKMNGAAPGIFNGNPETGIPASEAGYAPRAASGGGATQTREPTDAPGSTPTPTPEVAASSATPTSVYNPQDAATYWNATGAGNWTTQNIASDTRGAQRWAIPEPANWANMTPAQREAWKMDWYNPYQTMSDYYKSAPDEKALTAFRRAYSSQPFYDNLDGLPGTASQAGLSGPLNIANNADPASWSAQYGVNDPKMIAALQLLRSWGGTINQAGSTPTNPEYIGNLTRNYGDLSGLLQNVYGITYDPRSYVATPNPSNTGDETIDLPANTTLDTTLPDVTTKVPDLLQAIGGKMENAPLLETAMGMEMYRRALDDRQKGVNILDNVVKDTMASNNPLRALSEQLSKEALQNPDPVDWSGIKNRLATDYGRARETGATQLSQALAGRGLDPGSGVSMQARMAGDNRMGLARALGELDTQEQQSKRASIYDAITNAANVDRNYRGAESTARQILANAVMGTPQAAQNPYAGVTDYRLGREAMQIQKDANDAQAQAAQNALWGDLGGALLGVGGAFLGGPAFGAMMGAGATAGAPKTGG